MLVLRVHQILYHSAVHIDQLLGTLVYPIYVTVPY